MEYTIGDIINALAASGLHSAECPQGWVARQQKYTDKYLTEQECDCWVDKN